MLFTGHEVHKEKNVWSQVALKTLGVQCFSTYRLIKASKCAILRQCVQVVVQNMLIFVSYAGLALLL